MKETSYAVNQHMHLSLMERDANVLSIRRLKLRLRLTPVFMRKLVVMAKR